MDLDELNRLAVRAAEALKVDDAVALSARTADSMVRFADNSATVANRVDEAELTVYLAKAGRRAIASTSNLSQAAVEGFVKDLHASMKGLPQGEYAPLPDGAAKYSQSGRFDRKVADAEEKLPELAKAAIDSSLAAGGKRSAGAISAWKATVAILTTSGTRGSDSRTAITLNIRSFGEGDASGHGLSCSSTLRGFDPVEAGRRAGEGAKRMRQAAEPDAGKYEVLLSPAVASNLTETVAGAASAFSVDAGTSYLAGKLGKKVAAPPFDLTDHGVVDGGLGGRAFDDEGSPTRATKIIEGGVLRGYLHNLTTAKKWKAETTGSAGLIAPHPWNLEVGAGDSSYEEMVKEMKKGIVLTSNWYTRFNNYRTGEFSTVPRDGAYLVEDGEIVRSLKGLRAGDDQLRLFSSVRLLSKEREWVQWWEVDTPTLCPWILVDGVSITRAYD
ncbi:MAG: TldD/PmbA family protein [Nitrososphaerota archaeon]|jgi:PmbA protein|nr:TldD/PmbA family protein [Nitrososphaerota archaeon]MDG6945433.1 TldD/PmbA family protein [Nitrososphaerota archaeon]MDG6961245.1 TldD/PmbA family protein [Nitrososphaerota archaeon]MDG6963288.1 TldD/PmbA family protein [Nitrososphaerota archaeon]MDG6970811.1 TldD/PmbA family protein [Nitrososphaerota archaeon]